MRSLTPEERADLEALADADLRSSRYAKTLLELDSENQG